MVSSRPVTITMSPCRSLILVSGTYSPCRGKRGGGERERRGEAPAGSSVHCPPQLQDLLAATTKQETDSNYLL